MSMCKICHRDSKKHSAKLWRLHEIQKKCVFCGKSSEKHSNNLWEIHEKAIPKGKKLVVIQHFFSLK